MTNNSNELIVPTKEIQNASHVDYFEDTSPPSLELLHRNELLGQIGRLAAGQLLIAPGHDFGAPNGATIREVPHLDSGRKRSMREVRFGQLGLTRDDMPPATELVAIKYTEPEVALREYAANRYVDAQLGRQATFQTIGFIRAENSDMIGHITRYDNSVATLDNTLLNPSSSDEERGQAVSIAAKYLAALHGEIGLAHGDAQAKNIGIQPGDEPFLHFVDLEAAFAVTTNYHGAPVGYPILNKLADIHAFFALPDEAEDWQPTPDEIMLFTDQYLASQTGSHPVDEADIFEVVAEKMFDDIE